MIFNKQFDVVIYGDDVSGVYAAAAAASHGLSVCLISPCSRPSGMPGSGALGYADYGDYEVAAGPSDHDIKALKGEYAGEVHRISSPEPHVFAAWCEMKLDRYGITVIRGGLLDRGPEGVTVLNGSITQIRLMDGRVVAGRAFVDADQHGDLMVAAGLPYRIGREPVGLYGEPYAGVRSPFADRELDTSPFGQWADVHNIPGIFPAIRKGGGFKYGLRAFNRSTIGSGDGACMAFQYRGIQTNDPRLRVRFDKEPDGYDPNDYCRAHDYFRLFGAGLPYRKVVGTVQNLPNGKADMNSIGFESLNLIDGQYWRNYLSGSHEYRAEVRAFMKARYLGFQYWLRHDAPIEASHISEAAMEFGLSRDEFPDNDHVPYLLYVREGARFAPTGDNAFILTARDVLGSSRFDDSNLLGSYNVDVREVNRVAVCDPQYDDQWAVRNEGYLSLKINRPYEIPYRCLHAGTGGISNLGLPVTPAMSHLAYASYRMEPQKMMAGTALGTAIAQALANRTDGGPADLSGVDVAVLQRQLRSIGAMPTLDDYHRRPRAA